MGSPELDILVAALRVLHLETARGRTSEHIGTTLSETKTTRSETIGAIDTGSANPSAVLDSVLDSAT